MTTRTDPKWGWALDRRVEQSPHFVDIKLVRADSLCRMLPYPVARLHDQATRSAGYARAAVRDIWRRDMLLQWRFIYDVYDEKTNVDVVDDDAARIILDTLPAGCVLVRFSHDEQGTPAEYADAYGIYPAFELFEFQVPVPIPEWFVSPEVANPEQAGASQ